MQRNRVVITGLGVISGLGKDVNEFWQNVTNCRSAIAPIRSMDMSNIRFQNGCEVKDYRPLDYFPAKELDILDKFSQFGLIAAQEAVADAGIEWTDERKQKIGRASC